MTRAQATAVAAQQRDEDAADRPPLQPHETLGELIAQLQRLERDVGSDAYVIYSTSRHDAARLLQRTPSRFCAPYAPPYATAVQPSRFVVGQQHAFAPPIARRDGYIPLPNAVVVNGGFEW